MARKSRKVDNLTSEAGVLVQSSSTHTPRPTPTFPAWVYARISQDSDRADDSIDNQTALCKQFIQSSDDLTFAGSFSDLGYSGTNFDRPGYSEMMTGILAGTVTCVVVKDLSRIGRTYIEVGELLFDTFVKQGIRFISVNDNYDSFADDAGRKKLLILFKNLVNHMYSRDLGKKIKSAHDAKKRRGEPAGQAPYGYRIDKQDKQLKIVPDTAQIVQLIFNMKLAGDSIMAISKHLTRENIPSPQQRRYELGEITHAKFSGRLIWSESNVSKILHNETYTGSLFQGKYECQGKKKRLLPKDQWIVHKNTHEAIITMEQFNAVAELMGKAAEKHKKTGKLPREENRYAGKIACRRCSKTALRSDNRMKQPVLYYYACRYCCTELKEQQGLSKSPKLPLIKLDDIIMATVKIHMDALVQFDDLAEKLATHDPLKGTKAEIQRKIKQLEKTLDTYETTLATAYTHHLGAVLDLREYELVRDKIESEQKQAQIQLASLQATRRKYDTNTILENQWLTAYRAFRDCKTPTKELIQTLIGRIILTPITNELEIQLNFAEDFLELNQIISQVKGASS